MLQDINFYDLDLSGWNFNDTVMRAPNFVHCGLEDCSFRNAYIQALLFRPLKPKSVCNFINARRPGALFVLPDAFEDLPLSRADLSGSKVEYRQTGGTSAEWIRLATVGAAGVEVAQDVLAETQSAVQPLVPYLDTLRWVFIAAALAGIAVAIYARIDDWKRGRR